MPAQWRDSASISSKRGPKLRPRIRRSRRVYPFWATLSVREPFRLLLGAVGGSRGVGNMTYSASAALQAAGFAVSARRRNSSRGRRINAEATIAKLSLAAVAVMALALPAGPAQAQSFFEALF